MDAIKKNPSWSPAAIAKLASSGLSVEDAEQLGMTFLHSTSVVSLHEWFKPFDSIHIPYTDPHTGSGFIDLIDRPPFYRLRYLLPPQSLGFGQKDKRQRYTNEPGCNVHAYFPQFPGIDWPAVAGDTGQPLVITEGELKAAKACKEGFLAIGLGGVDSFSSQKRGVELLPELERIRWSKRRTFVVYDSDSADNPEVKRAVIRIAKTLAKRGAIVFEVQLQPGPEGQKVGLDDYLVAAGGDAFQSLLGDHGDEKTQRSVLVNNDPLFKLNDEVVYIREKGFFIHQKTHVVMKRETFSTTYANLPKCREPAENKQGFISVPATKAWVEWPNRTDAGRVVYEPQKYGVPFSRMTTHDDPSLSTWNVWPGWGVVPDDDDVDDEELMKFHSVVDHVFKGAEPGAKEWFLQWLAYPLQYPGTKLFTAVIIHGQGQGTGKTLLGDTMKRIYGENYTMIGNRELKSSFNGWAARKQFILGDEITGSDRREFSEELKRMITSQVIRVNEKNIPEYELNDVANYLFTSNHANAFSISDRDRRYFVHEVTSEPLDEDFFMPYYIWLDSGGAAAIFRYLLDLDVSEFNPKKPAPMTAAKRQMIEFSRSDLEAWALALRDDPESVLNDPRLMGIMKGDLFSPAQLLRAYDPEEKTKVKARGLGLALNGIIPKVHNGDQIRGPVGKTYYYAVRNADLWATATLEEIKAHLNDPRQTVVGNVTAVRSRKRRSS